jgi:electron transfer flavoprotein beta subunit
VGVDGLATAKVLLSAVRAEAPDLVLTGVRAVDADQEQVGPMLGTLLGWATATSVAEFDLAGTILEVVREVEGGRDRVELTLPAVVSLTKAGLALRRPSLAGIMASKKKPMEVRDAEVIGGRVRAVALKLPAEKRAGKVVGEGPDAVPELLRLLREEAGAL